MNHHPSTGVAYAIVAANDLEHEVVTDLMFGPGATDHDYDSAWAEHLSTVRSAHIAQHGNDDLDLEQVQTLFNDRYECQEPHVTGVYEGVRYQTCWLGGALHFAILESPVMDLGRPGSPCVPGMCVLQHPDNDHAADWYSGYGVPQDWWLVREAV